MRFLFDDDAFSFETLRTAGFALYGGADLAEVLVTAAAISGGDDAAGTGHGRRPRSGCRRSASRPWPPGTRSARGKRCCARRTTTGPQRTSCSNSQPPTRKWRCCRPASTTASPPRPLSSIPRCTPCPPYEDTAFPAYLFLADDSGAARPTIIYNSGYDSPREESWFAIAAAALRRGYNVLAFDGPGQGAVLREQKLVMRPDWETVITPVIDYALTRGEIASGQIVLFGYSLGGYLVARAAAFDHRVAALILDDGIHDFHAVFTRSLPPFLASWIAQRRDDVAVPVLTMLTAVSTQVRWGLRNGMWVFGADSFADMIRRAADYTLSGIAHQVTAPTLIMDGENDQFLKGQPQLFGKALTGAPTTLVTLTSAEGAGEHTSRCPRPGPSDHVRLRLEPHLPSPSLTQQDGAGSSRGSGRRTGSSPGPAGCRGPGLPRSTR